MNNIQNKFESGISKIQDGIDTGKSKLDERKTVANYNKMIEEVQCKRDNLLLEIGTLVYEKIRLGEIADLEIVEKCNPLLGFDYTIYDNKMKIEELNKSNSAYVCDCGTELLDDSKFCSGCGNKVEDKSEAIEYINCSSCDMNIASDSNFCPCCGHKVEFDFSNFKI